ncbi:Activating signal cointegrator 1 complex subunit 2 [Amphibalanus amphitrite]|uniref:Activating signal cointegrator 1 complex subunit 2 n=1 Tax=Amphibalanus amphitrite TaxID=1232801 RepID=A0A6A4VB23_AMPAM|nr:Activating signal cointegrator 1 complex subunit 2 [Amphibalanus amphitrite]
MVSHVQDLLPDLSRSFVMACLEHYNFSSERVINALLEDSLPPSAGIARPYRRRRMTEARLARELADKSSLREAGQRERYQLFGSLTTDGSVYEAIHYEDDGPVPLNQPLPSSRWRRPDPAAEEDQETAGPRRDHFVQDPAEVRARQEARRQEQQQRRRGRGRGGHHGPPPNRDVVGAPRGQGQDKQVLQNRRRKNEQKSYPAPARRRPEAEGRHVLGAARAASVGCVGRVPRAGGGSPSGGCGGEPGVLKRKASTRV